MRIKQSISSGLLATAMLALIPSAASAWSPKLEVNENTWVQLGYLHQFWYQSIDDGAGVAGDRNRSNDFFTRRNRIMLLGQAAEKVHFFVNYDAPAGAVSGGASTPVLTDAMIDFRIAKEFTVVVGRQLVPFSVDNQSSAVTLLGIDYPTRALANQPTVASTAFWRDDGISVRGLLGDGKFDYRVGYFRGDRDGTNNADGDGRITGMVMFNLAQSQGWFFNPNSLGALDVLSFGVGYDRMSRSGASADDHKAFSVFGIAEKKLGAGHLSANFGYYDWEGVVGGFGDGKSMSLAVGFLPEGSKWQPVVRWQQQDPDSPTGTKLDTVGLGLNYYLSGHRVNIKAEYSIDDSIIDGSKKDAFRVQTQLFF